MKGYIQRNPFAPKPIWWKKFDRKASVGNITVYTVSSTVGFVLDEVRQIFNSVTLISGHLSTSDTVSYVSIATTENNEIVPTKAIKFRNKIFMYDTESGKVEEQDFAEDGIDVIEANTNSIVRFERNQYVRQHAFDATEEADEENSSYQPIPGLLTNSSYLTLKTFNFNNQPCHPKQGDLIYYFDKFWMIDETSKTYTYEPRRKTVLHISMKAVNK